MGLELIPGPKVPAEAIRQARALLRASSETLSALELGREIARCLTGAKSRKTESADIQMLTEIFLEELATKPADAVRQALRDWVKESVWWPSPAEILAKVERLTSSRRSLAGILDRLERESAQEPQEYRQLSQEQRAHRLSKLAALKAELTEGMSMNRRVGE